MNSKHISSNHYWFSNEESALYPFSHHLCSSSSITCKVCTGYNGDNEHRSISIYIWLSISCSHVMLNCFQHCRILSFLDNEYKTHMCQHTATPRSAACRLQEHRNRTYMFKYALWSYFWSCWILRSVVLFPVSCFAL